MSNSSVRVGWSGGWRLPGSGQGQPPVLVQPAEGERHEDKKESGRKDCQAVHGGSPHRSPAGGPSPRAMVPVRNVARWCRRPGAGGRPGPATGGVANPRFAEATRRALPNRWRPRLRDGAGDIASGRIRSGEMFLFGPCSSSCCPPAKAFVWPVPRRRVDRLRPFHGYDVGPSSGLGK